MVASRAMALLFEVSRTQRLYTFGYLLLFLPIGQPALANAVQAAPTLRRKYHACVEYLP
jgi:hypothetical protein